VSSVRARAAAYGRHPELSGSFRRVRARTDDLAWKRAHGFLARIEAGGFRQSVAQMIPGTTDTPPNAGPQRLLAAAARAERTDRALALLEAGAHDAWITPIVMKKGRPDFTVSVLADPAAFLIPLSEASRRESYER